MREPCPLPLVALAARETCPRCGRPAREHRGHPAYEETTMTETTEPTREKIAQWLAQAEAQLAAMAERAEKAERERDEARSRIVEQIKQSLPHAMENAKAVYKYDGNESRARAMAVLIVDEALQCLHFDDMQEYIRAKLAEFSRAKLAAMHRRAQRAESATADARREAIGQRKRADWWRREAKRLGWTPDYPELREEPTSDARIDCESSSLLLLSTWARKVMMRPKNRAKGVPTQSILELLRMAWHELSEARWAITDDAPTDDILAELGDAAAIISFAMREIEKRRKA